MANEGKIMLIILKELAKNENFENTFYNCYNKICDFVISKNDYIVFNCDEIFEDIADLNPRALLFGKYFKDMKKSTNNKKKYETGKELLEDVINVSKDMISLLNDFNTYDDIIDYYRISEYPYKEVITSALNIVSIFGNDNNFEKYVLDNFQNEKPHTLKKIK